ncbi:MULTISPECIES: NAD-dependent epimerase/dehydratase family protein [Sorangium]|uniref:NDP-sugar oxidoreductase n=1 Tax=Sorangium cellulosum (strain So ce56) TaxID=448385 RepID=A9FWI6_SORC5|nr:NAD(P)-dependent oxidoreductase [Sorangium cellulosum]CAN92383.1 NDP-sugar oxidoreductase [Sorangium cellulosum So ce56]
MNEAKRILVTGAAGKVGQTFIRRFLSNPAFEGWKVRALCHNRMLERTARVEVLRGAIEDRAVVNEATEGVTHVLHLATSKETPESIMDVAVKGMFWLLEACRVSPAFEQFILVGGDAGMGHFFYPHPVPVTEAQRHSAYPGCYALSKVLEEVMLEQYYIQYELNGCCLRAPWIMEKDDFKAQLSFGDDVFGGPRWRDLVGTEAAEGYVRSGAVPVMLDRHGEPVKRNFVHVEDLVTAIVKAINHEKARQQTFNICMDEPVDYGELARYLEATRGLPSVRVKTPFHSTWLDNSKAKFLLGWRPQYDLARLTDAAFDYVRAPDDPRVTWYPG